MRRRKRFEVRGGGEKRSHGAGELTTREIGCKKRINRATSYGGALGG